MVSPIYHVYVLVDLGRQRMVEDEAGSVSSDVGQLHRWPPPAMQDVVRDKIVLIGVLTRMVRRCTIAVGKSLGGASQ